MKKYKQIEIPTVVNDWKSITATELRRNVKDYYAANLQGKTITNKDIGIVVYFTGYGKGKLSQGGALYANKAILVKVLDKLVELAEYNNFGKPKANDPKSVIGHLNFKAKVKIDNAVKHIRITITMKTDGKFYYNHEVNKILNA